VVVVDFRNLGAAAGGVGAVAVEFGFVEQVGAGAVEDAEGADLQEGADGGDAERVDALVDGEASTRSSAISFAPEGSAYQSITFGMRVVWWLNRRWASPVNQRIPSLSRTPQTTAKALWKPKWRRRTSPADLWLVPRAKVPGVNLV
jgi:hypothetical protein